MCACRLANVVQVASGAILLIDNTTVKNRSDSSYHVVALVFPCSLSSSPLKPFGYEIDRTQSPVAVSSRCIAEDNGGTAVVCDGNRPEITVRVACRPRPIK